MEKSIMKISLKLLESDDEINRRILNALVLEIDSIFKKSIKPIRTKIIEEVKKALMSEPEYQSLISGQLKYEFGIPVSSKVNDIIEIWSSNINIEYKPIKINSRGLSGGFLLNMIRDNFDDVLGNESAIVVDSVSGITLPWLEWLLLYGGKIIVKNYKVRMGSNRNSRTGMAIMVESEGNNWRVPPEFAGTLTNNWVTRAINKLDNKIISILESELEKSI
jgi:hypothetical protein